MTPLTLTLVLLVSASPEWQAGSFHGVVTGESGLEAARRAFGPPINDVVDYRDDRPRRITFRPLTVDVPTTDGGAPSALQVGVQVFLDRETRRVVRIRLTPWPESKTSGATQFITPIDRRIVKQIVDVPFTERRIEYCESGPLWRGEVFDGQAEPAFFLLAPEHGVTVSLQDQKYVVDIEVSATLPNWFDKDSCLNSDGLRIVDRGGVIQGIRFDDLDVRLLDGGTLFHRGDGGWAATHDLPGGGVGLYPVLAPTEYFGWGADGAGRGCRRFPMVGRRSPAERNHQGFED